MEELDGTDWPRLRARLRDGDVEAHTLLFRTTVDRVHRLAASLCGDAALAEDVTAETFLIVWRRRSMIAYSQESLLPWLLAVAARQALNAVRGRRRQAMFVTQHGRRFDTAAPDIADHVAARLDDTALLRRTQLALSALNASEVEVLALCVWSGLSTREVAQALQVAPGTVRSRLSRARSRLRTLIDDDHHPETTDTTETSGADRSDDGPRRSTPELSRAAAQESLR